MVIPPQSYVSLTMYEVQGQGWEVCLRTQALLVDLENLTVDSFLMLEEEALEFGSCKYARRKKVLNDSLQIIKGWNYILGESWIFLTTLLLM